jgi:hypothetical protein
MRNIEVCTRSLKMQVVTLATLLAFSLAFIIPRDVVAQNNPVQRATNSILVSGTSAGNTFNGILKVTSVAANTVTGGLTANGTITGTVTNAAGQVVQTVTNLAVTNLPVASVSGSCTILTLTLGPLHLDLLGLVVDLNQVVLNITAQPGPGNLLGNLLCSVAGLLNRDNLSSVLTQLVGLLNQILAGL